MRALRQPIIGIKGIEAKMPMAVPKISDILGQIANKIPELPTGMSSSPGIRLAKPKVPAAFRSIEAILPNALPKVSQLIDKGSISSAPAKAPNLIFE